MIWGYGLLAVNGEVVGELYGLCGRGGGLRLNSVALHEIIVYELSSLSKRVRSLYRKAT